MINALLIQFISQNKILCICCIIFIITYICFEYLQKQSYKKYISITNAIYLHNKNQGIFIDVRKKNEYNKKRILNAIHFDIATFSIDNKLLKTYKKYSIIIYCKNSKKYSQKAYKLLKQLGYNKIYILQGGINQWQAENIPIEFTKQSIKK